jgi:hypothetical protein
LLKSIYIPARNLKKLANHPNKDQGTYEISMETITSWVTISKNEWLLSLTWGPLTGELRSVPVDLIEEMRSMDPSFGAVSMGWELHVSLVSIKSLRWVVAGREVDISPQRRSITITVLIWETNTGTLVSWILNSNAMKTIRIGRIQGLIGV